MPRVIFRPFDLEESQFKDLFLIVPDMAHAETALKAFELALDQPTENTHEVYFADDTGKETHQWDPDSLRWMTPEEKQLKESEDA